MLYLSRTFHNFELKFDTAYLFLARLRPLMFLFGAFIGIPLFILTAVFFASVTIIFPIAMLLGWR